jgi:integron integrase
LLDRLRDALRARQVSDATIAQYLHWATQYILFHGKRHPQELTEDHVQRFLDHLAASRDAAPDGPAAACRALVFLYGELLERPLKEPLLQVPPPGSRAAAEPSAAPAPARGITAPPPAPRLLDQVRDQLRLRHYSLKTERCYVRWITQFILFHHKRHPRELGVPAIEQFLTHLAVDATVAASTQNQAFFALLFLYQQVLGIELGRIDALRAKRPERLPVVMSRTEVRQVLDAVEGAAGLYPLMCQLQYGSGLRIQEVCQVRVHDLDLDRGQLLVRDGKGRKDRVVMVPRLLRERLAQHLDRRRRLHEHDQARGVANVWLPDALARKYPQAPQQLGWQFLFASRQLSEDPRSGQRARHHLYPGRLAAPSLRLYASSAWSNTSPRTPSGTASPRTCSRTATISAPCRNSSATRTSPPR